MNDEQVEALRQRYLADQVSTASPAQRLLMLFDHLGRDLQLALSAFEAGNLKEISDRLVHAQEIIAALRDPLDTSSDLGRSLDALYSFCLAQLVRANFEKDPELVPPVAQMIDRVAQANRTVFQQMSDQVERAG